MVNASAVGETLNSGIYITNNFLYFSEVTPTRAKMLGAGCHYSILICCLLSLHTVSMYISFLFEMPRMLLHFCGIDRIIVDKTNKGNIFSAGAYFLSCKAIEHRIFIYQRIWLGVRTIGNTLLREIPNLQDERRSPKYATKEMIAPPKHIPVPMRRTTSTPRMFAQVGLLIIAKRFMTPKKVSRKEMRGNLRRLFIDCPFNCLSDSRFIIKCSFACALRTGLCAGMGFEKRQARNRC